MRYDNPGGGGDKLAVADVVGKALLVRPIEHIECIPTVHGDRDAIRIDVVDLTTGVLSRDVLWFGGRIIGATKGKLGSLILCHITQGTATRPGQNAPWDMIGLADNAEAVAAADAWLASNPGVLTPAAAATVQAAPSVATGPAVQVAPSPII